MGNIIIMKLQHTKNQYFVTVPKAIVELKGWRKGDQIHFYENKKGEIVLRSGKE